MSRLHICIKCTKALKVGLATFFHYHVLLEPRVSCFLLFYFPATPWLPSSYHQVRWPDPQKWEEWTLHQSRAI